MKKLNVAKKECMYGMQGNVKLPVQRHFTRNIDEESFLHQNYRYRKSAVSPETSCMRTVRKIAKVCPAGAITQKS